MLKKLTILVLAVVLPFLGIYVVGFSVFTLNALNVSAHTTKNVQAVIILTGGENRIKEGVRLLKSEKSLQIFISGVGENITIKNIFPETHKDLKCCVNLGHKALDTMGNAEESYKWLADQKDIRSFYLVTSSYHIPRAYQIFKNHKSASKYTIHKYPVKMERLSPDKREFWNLMFEEYNKLIYTWSSLKIVTK
ncbi:MAG: YdcF family protein [Alphaproteobacteria bacterium]|nr:YdcF family protein [Alphaproteobacteria bacterium]